MKKTIQQVRKNRNLRNNIIGKIIFPFVLLLQCIFWLLRFCKLENLFFWASFIPISRRIHNRMESSFSSYEPKEQDVFICSYFKSGTNWTMQIANEIAYKGNTNYEHIHDLVPWPDAPVSNYSISLSDNIFSPFGKRVIKTHLTADKIPYNEKAQYICVVRDPKDVFVSSYFFVRSTLLGRLMPSVAAWLNAYLSKYALHRSWATFLDGYWRWRHRKNVVFITYEEIKNDLENAIKKIADLMGIALEKEEIEKIKYLSSYKYMKTIDHKFSPGRLTPISPGNAQMIRRGQRGSSSELITKEQQQRIDAYCIEDLKELQSDFPYNNYYGENSKI